MGWTRCSILFKPTPVPHIPLSETIASIEHDPIPETIAAAQIHNEPFKLRPVPLTGPTILRDPQHLAYCKTISCSLHVRQAGATADLGAGRTSGQTRKAHILQAAAYKRQRTSRALIWLLSVLGAVSKRQGSGGLAAHLGQCVQSGRGRGKPATAAVGGEQVAHHWQAVPRHIHRYHGRRRFSCWTCAPRPREQSVAHDASINALTCPHLHLTCPQMPLPSGYRQALDHVSASRQQMLFRLKRRRGPRAISTTVLVWKFPLKLFCQESAAEREAQTPPAPIPAN